MSSMTTDHGLIHASSRIRSVVSVAARRGYDLPADYTTAHEVEKEAARLALEQPPVFGELPTKGKDVAARITAHAEALVRHDRQRAVAQEVVDRATRASYRAIQDNVSLYVKQVCDDFEAHVAEFRELLAVAPRGVTAQMTGKEFEQHAKLMRAADALTADAVDRGMLALLTDEVEETGGNALWLILAPVETVTLQNVRDVLSEFSGRFPNGIEEWAAMVALGCQMARGGGDVGQRLNRFNALVLAASHGPDAGMRDKTLAEAYSMPGAPQHPVTDRSGWEDTSDPLADVRGIINPPEVHPQAASRRAGLPV